jgi:hypothetical protein
MHSLIESEFFQDYASLVFHIFCCRRLDGDGEVDSNAKAVARSELRENLRAQSVPALRRNLPNQAEGYPLRFDWLPVCAGVRLWLRDRLGFGRRP